MIKVRLEICRNACNLFENIFIKNFKSYALKFKTIDVNFFNF